LKRRHPNVALKMIIEARHPQGEPDLLCPVLYCDVCGERLDGKRGDYIDVYAYRRPEGTQAEDDYYAGKASVPLSVMHGGTCFDRFNEKHGYTGYMPIDHLPVYLAAQLGLAKTREDWNKLWDRVVDV
jgi:hypothetical protein